MRRALLAVRIGVGLWATYFFAFVVDAPLLARLIAITVIWLVLVVGTGREW